MTIALVVPRSIKIAVAAVSVLLLLVMVPVIGPVAGQVLLVPGGIVAGAIISVPAEGRSLAQSLMFFVLMVAIDVFVYAFVIQTVRRMLGKTSDPQEDAEIRD